MFIERLPFETDAGIAAKARCALVTLATDQTIEEEFRRIVPAPGVGLYHTRLWNDAEINMETLRAIEARIEPAVRLLLPGDAFDVIAFGCTSATMVIGEARVDELIRRAKPGAQVTNPLRAMTAAFAAQGAHSVAVLTPYVRSVNERLREYLIELGMSVPVFGSFNEADDRVVARISVDSLERAAAQLVRQAPVQGLFISCTSIRLLDAVERMEAIAGVPVTSSNHAMAWHMLQLAGVPTAGRGPGRLFR